MTETKPGNYVGMPAAIRLDAFGGRIFDAFGQLPYLVGSATTTKEWRDIDVRLMLPDDEFAALFPRYARLHQLDPMWALLCDALSELARQQTGLPVDFQIQSQTDANTRYPNGFRNPLGLRLTDEPGESEPADGLLDDAAVGGDR